MVAIILLGPSAPYSYHAEQRYHRIQRFTPRNLMVKWTVYLVLFVIVLLLTISKLRFPSIVKLADCAVGRKLVSWRRVAINLCMFAAMVMLLYTFDGMPRLYIITIQVYALAIVSFGNLQLPAALLRIMMALDRLMLQNYYGDDAHIDKSNLGDKTNLVSSLNIFYVMVLGQGILYLVACIL